MYSDPNVSAVDPRVTALTEALSRLNTPDIDFKWAAVLDYDGLIMANYPPDDEASMETAIASSSHILRMGEKAQEEAHYGKWRFTMITGAEMQQLVIHLNNEVVLTFGVGSKTPLHKVFGAVRDVVPAMVSALDLVNRKFTEPNTLLMHSGDLQNMLRR
jgi:predicted regulator of Ras-like GTPase activity (Roadblock/LC7/MglB family)